MCVNKRHFTRDTKVLQSHYNFIKIYHKLLLQAESMVHRTLLYSYFLRVFVILCRCILSFCV